MSSAAIHSQDGCSLRGDAITPMESCGLGRVKVLVCTEQQWRRFVATLVSRHDVRLCERQRRRGIWPPAVRSLVPFHALPPRFSALYSTRCCHVALFSPATALLCCQPMVGCRAARRNRSCTGAHPASPRGCVICHAPCTHSGCHHRSLAQLPPIDGHWALCSTAGSPPDQASDSAPLSLAPATRQPTRVQIAHLDPVRSVIPASAPFCCPRSSASLLRSAAQLVADSQTVVAFQAPAPQQHQLWG